MANAKEMLDGVNGRIMGLFKADKQSMMAYSGLAQAATRAGKLSPAIKELTALSIAVAKGCEDCIVYHAAAAKKHGASREEMVEMLMVAVEMAGGPGVVYAAKAVQIFDELP